MTKDERNWAVFWFSGTVFVSIVLSIVFGLVGLWAPDFEGPPWWFSLLPMALVPGLLLFAFVCQYSIMGIAFVILVVFSLFGIELFGEE